MLKKIIDLYGDLYKIWNKELNSNLDPWSISIHSTIEAWFNCPDGKHEPYKRDISHSTRFKYRCPECFERPKGENHPNWNPNLTQEERENGRNIEGYTQFIKDVLKRDNYTCQITGKKSTPDLEVHHLDGYHWCKEKRIDVDNGITICRAIHYLFHNIYGRHYNTKEQFKEFLMKIESGEIDISNIE